jgi:uncharacterized RDD family membrane protein YckC
MTTDVLFGPVGSRSKGRSHTAIASRVVTEPERPGLLGRAAGALTGKMVDTIPPDVILDHVDLDALLDRIDVNHLLDRIDIDRLLARVDANRLLEGLDVDALLRTVDIEALVRRSGVPDIVAESTGRMAGGALDLARRQVVGLDTVLVGAVGTVLRHPSAGLGRAPEALRPAVEAAEAGDRRTVSGTYAGPVSRLLAAGIDAALIFVLFTLGVAGVDFLSRVFLDRSLQGTGDSPWAVAGVVAWAYAYVLVTTVVAGRTPGKGIVGLRVVSTEGEAVRPRRALIRTLMFPFSAAFLGLGFLPILLARDRRGLHDVLAGTAVVYDWGDRPAQMPAPLSAFLAERS